MLNSNPQTYFFMFQLAPYGLTIVSSFLLSPAFRLLLDRYCPVPIVLLPPIVPN